MTRRKPQTIVQVFQGTYSYTSTAGICPHCGNAATFKECVRQQIPNAVMTSRPRPDFCLFVEVARCDACNCITIGVKENAGTGHTQRVQHLWPNEEWVDRAPEGIEEHVKSSYDEARAVLSLSPTAAAVLARRCLQQVLRDRLSIKENTLFAEIEKAEKREEFSKPTREALHHVRKIGNWGAHATHDQAATLIDVTRDDAEYTLETIEMVFDDLYVASERVAKMGQRLSDRKLDATAV